MDSVTWLIINFIFSNTMKQFTFLGFVLQRKLVKDKKSKNQSYLNKYEAAMACF